MKLKTSWAIKKIIKLKSYKNVKKLDNNCRKRDKNVAAKKEFYTKRLQSQS